MMIIYLKDFMVEEVTEIVRIDERKKSLVFKPIDKRSLRRPEDIKIDFGKACAVGA